MTVDFAQAGEIVDIPELGKRRRAPDDIRYRYAENAARCPNCGGFGVPWGGWFSCDGGGDKPHCLAVALVSTGEVFLLLEDTDAGVQ